MLVHAIAQSILGIGIRIGSDNSHLHNAIPEETPSEDTHTTDQTEYKDARLVSNADDQTISFVL